jgi:large subunit ribosomal protein L19
MNITDIVEVKTNPNIKSIAPGDTVKVRQKVVEGEKTRIQVFQGVVIKIHHAAAGTNFTVRRVTSGVGVERTFPIYSPMIDGVEVMRHGKVRRAKLYYLRGLSARASRIKEKRLEKIGEEIKPVQPPAEQEEAAPEAQATGQTAVVAAEATPLSAAPPAETPKAEKPKAEAPKADTFKAKAPKVEAPKAEALAPAAPEAEKPKPEEKAQ